MLSMAPRLEVAGAEGRPGTRQATAALVVAAVLTIVWVGDEIGVATRALPGRALPWLWLVVPLAFVGLRGRPPSLSREVELARRCPAWLLGLVLIALVLAIWIVGQRVSPYFGHDEAVYATKARELAGVAPASQWENYRPPLLPVLGAPIVALGGGVGALRGLTLALSLATLAVLAWSAGGRRHPGRATVTVLIFISGFAFQRRAPEFLNDLAAAGLLLGGAELVIRSRRPGNGPLLSVAALVLVVAFYLRYGVVSGFVGIAVGALAAYGLRTWFRPIRATLLAGAVVLVGLLPHLIWASVTVGSPWGVLTAAEGVAGRAYVGQGLVEYVVSFPWLYVGDYGGLVMAVGIIAGGLALRRRMAGADTEADRRAIVMTVAAVTQVVLLGVTAHGEERFVFFAIMALLVVGVESITRWAGSWSAPTLLATACAALVALPATARWTADVRFAPATDERTSLAAAAAHVPFSSTCLVVTGYRPEMGWDTRCATVTGLGTVPAALRRGRVVTVVRFDHGRYQGSRTQLARLIAGRSVQRITLPAEGSLGAAQLYVLRP
jgi:hypothetical protein